MNDIIARRKLRVNNGKRKRPIEDEGSEVDDDDDESESEEEYGDEEEWIKPEYHILLYGFSAISSLYEQTTTQRLHESRLDLKGATARPMQCDKREW